MSNNISAVIRKMRQRKIAMRREMDAAARQLALELNRASKQEMAPIYASPIPVNKKGKPKWRRTGNLRRLETARSEGPNIILENRAAYAAARYTLGTPQSKRRPGPTTVSVQWQEAALVRLRSRILERRREAALKALTRP